MNAALKCSNANDLVDSLPTILLGHRSTIKADTNVTPAEMVYGTTLNLPGEFFNTSNKSITQTEYVNNLIQIFENL